MIAEPDMPFECRMCHFCVPLDDVALLMSDGWRCVCLRCWLAAVANPDPPKARTAATSPPPARPGPLMRWWCAACEAEYRLALRPGHLRRPACPVCDAPLRRWDEHHPPRNPFGA